MWLANGDDEVVLVFEGLVIDAVDYDDGSRFPDTAGRSLSLDRDSLDSVLNDDGDNWCTGQPVYGAGDKGTPGAENDACP